MLWGRPWNVISIIMCSGICSWPSRSLKITPEAQPRYHRPCPYAPRSCVEAELEQLQREEVIEPVEHADWAAPITPVVKSDGLIRICGDFKVTLNQVVQQVMYSLLKMEDLLATLANGKTFSKHDLSHVYLQIQLDEEFKKLITINTSWGYTVIWGFSSTICIPMYNGEFIKGNPWRTHKSIVRSIYLGDRINGCRSFWKISRWYCHIWNKPVSSWDIQNALSWDQKLPTWVMWYHRRASIQQKTSFKPSKMLPYLPTPSSLISYYSRFFSNLSTLCWLHYTNSFRKMPNGTGNKSSRKLSKIQSLMAAPVLVHYQGNHPLSITCDVSSCGIGAVLVHPQENTHLILSQLLRGNIHKWILKA